MSDKPAPKTFSVVATVDDPLSADRLVAVLIEMELDAFVRARGGASTDTWGAISQGYWEVLVQSDGLERAERAVKEELDEIANDAEANAKAAEEEALSGETVVDPVE
jgi:hypothetical protein